MSNDSLRARIESVAEVANQQGKKSGYRRPVGDLTRFVAIVIDTNCYEKGHFNQGKVEGLAKRAAKKDVEVWVPGQVVVEWGRHAADDAKNSNTALGRLYRAGLLSASPVKAEDDATAVVDQLRKSVEAVENVRVLTERGGGFRDCCNPRPNPRDRCGRSQVRNSDRGGGLGDGP